MNKQKWRFDDELLFPTNYNSALMPMPLTDYERHMAKASADFRKLQKVAEASDPTPKERAETIGKVLQSGMLRAGTGYLSKRAQERRFPIMHDDEEKHRLNVTVGNALAQQPGHSFHPGMTMSDALSKIASPGVGSGVRKMVQENNQNLPPLNSRLPGQQGPTISEDTLEVMNSLPDARLRNGVVNALLARPPANPNDAYRWAQSIVSIASQVRTCCDEMGLDAGALLDALSRRMDFFDPLVGQSSPARFSSPRSSVSPNIESPSTFFDVEPPVEPMSVDPQFSGADSTDTNPDFREQKLAKFYNGLQRGVNVVKTASDRKLLEDYARVILQTEFDNASGLRKLIEQLHKTRSRVSAAEWRTVQRQPHFESDRQCYHELYRPHGPHEGRLSRPDQ